MLLIAAACLVFVSCNNKPAEEVTTEENTEVAAEEPHCCHEMTEEQKAFKADWENWENQTDERKAELIAKAKECFDQRMAEFEAHKAECEANKPECEAKKAECEAKKAEIDSKLANWDNMTIEEQKAFLDEVAPCCHGPKGPHGEGCCKGEGGKPCCKGEGEKPCCKGENKYSIFS